MQKLPYLNLGCGSHFDKRWTNVDFISTGEGVIAHNILQGIPFDNNLFDVVYHSHVLEHFHKKDGEEFIKECYRVLKPGGIIRIAIPDLEKIIENYTTLLNKLKANPSDLYLQACYDWIMLEMYDQTVRNSSGGSMLEFLSQEQIINEKFVIERCGYEVGSIINYLNESRKTATFKKSVKYRPTLKNRIVNLPATLKKKLILFLLGEDINALNIGKFRLGGEIHLWMYDSFSLSRLLNNIGFINVQKCDQYTSKIVNWSDYKLEHFNGHLRKPDSLFIEAIKGE